jgi:hypothetical protein
MHASASASLVFAFVPEFEKHVEKQRAIRANKSLSPSGDNPANLLKPKLKLSVDDNRSWIRRHLGVPRIEVSAEEFLHALIFAIKAAGSPGKWIFYAPWHQIEASECVWDCRSYALSPESAHKLRPEITPQR